MELRRGEQLAHLLNTSMVFYQKYRPDKFSKLVNQKPVKQALISAVKNDRVAHAYLFAGPRGTGKTTAARILAKVMNCESLEGAEPCGECENCQQSQKGSMVDLIETDAASNRGIDEIRELREKIKFSPTLGDYKIYIIDEVHMLTPEAFNALLKILEEPPEHAIFILATTDPHKVPETVLSRCQRFDFTPISIKKITAYLKKVADNEDIKIGRKALMMMAASAKGSLRDALGILEQVSSAVSGKVTVEKTQKILGVVENRAVIKLVDYLIESKAKEAVNLSNQLITKGFQPERIISAVNEYLRRLILIKFGLEDKDLPLAEEELKKAKNQAQKLTKKELNSWIEVFLKAKKTPSANLPQLPLEMAVLDIIEPKEREESKKNEKEGRGNKKQDGKAGSGKKKVKKGAEKKEAGKKMGGGDKENEGNKGEKINNQKEKKSQKIEKEKKTIGGEKEEGKEIKDCWPEVIERMKKYNHSLSAVLSHCQLKKVKEKILVLTTDRRFYQKRLMDRINKKKIEEVIGSVGEKRYQIECRLEETEDFVDNNKKGDKEKRNNGKNGKDKKKEKTESNKGRKGDNKTSDKLAKQAEAVFNS